MGCKKALRIFCTRFVAFKNCFHYEIVNFAFSFRSCCYYFWQCLFAVIAVDLVIGEQIVKVVSCYAPQAGRSQIEKDEFWRQTEGVLVNTDINQTVIVGGDMNGHVGEVANGFHEAHGNFGYGTRNAEGERILEFAEAMGYVVTSTLFKKRQSHLVTYES